MNDLPKGYARLPFPNFPDTPEGRRMYWQNTVVDRARIMDPMFHGGNTEAIRLIIGWEEKENPYFRGLWRKMPISGDWIEFRTFKEANAYVQAVKRLG